MSESEILAVDTALERKSEHQIAEAIVKHGTERNAFNHNVENFEAVPGAGVK